MELLQKVYGIWQSRETTWIFAWILEQAKGKIFFMEKHSCSCSKSPIFMKSILQNVYFDCII